MERFLTVRQRWDIPRERRRELLERIRAIRARRAARDFTGDSLTGAPKELRDYTMRTLLGLTRDVTKVDTDDIRSISRIERQVAARHLFLWLAYNFTAFSRKTTVEYVGRGDHTTSNHAVRRVDAVIAQYPHLMPDDDSCPTQWACAIWEVWGYAR